MNDNPVKCKNTESGEVLVGRFIQVVMFCSCNYGFIPHLFLSGDGDLVDALVL